MIHGKFDLSKLKQITKLTQINNNYVYLIVDEGGHILCEIAPILSSGFQYNASISVIHDHYSTTNYNFNIHEIEIAKFPYHEDHLNEFYFIYELGNKNNYLEYFL